VISEHERVLLASAQAGDHEAFATLYAVLTPGLTRFVRRLIGDAQDVDDVTQDTLFALYTHLPTLDPPEKLRPFLFRVARNRCTDILRRQGRYELVSVDLDEDDYGTVRVGSQNCSVNRRQKTRRAGCCSWSKCATRWIGCQKISAKR